MHAPLSPHGSKARSKSFSRLLEVDEWIPQPTSSSSSTPPVRTPRLSAGCHALHTDVTAQKIFSSARLMDPRKRVLFLSLCFRIFRSCFSPLAFGGFEGGGCARSHPIPDSPEQSPSSTRREPAARLDGTIPAIGDQTRALRFRGRRAFGWSAGRAVFGS